MLTLVVVLFGVAGFLTLAMRRAPLWQWAVLALAIGLLSRLVSAPVFGIDLFSWGTIFALLPAAILGLLCITPLRRALVAGPAYGLVKSILPRVSRTEQEALDAGTVGWDAELFSGKPRWDKLLGIRKVTLTAEEQAFLDGPAATVCSMIDDWDIRHNRADMPPEVWSLPQGAGLPRHAHRQGAWRARLFGAGAEPGGEQGCEPLGGCGHYRDGAQFAWAG